MQLKATLDKLPTKYEWTDKQKDNEEYYQRAVKLLLKAGIPAEYKKYWVNTEEDPVGYITIS